MDREREIRLGSVQTNYDSRQGLVFKDVHNPVNIITVCDSDLAELVTFVCQHSALARQAAASCSSPDRDANAE